MRSAPWILVVLMALVGGGCGGDDKGSSKDMDGGVDGSMVDGSADDGGTETIAEILKDVPVGTALADVPSDVLSKLQAHADAYTTTHREEWDTEGLLAKESTLLGSPTQEMTDNFDYFIQEQFYNELPENFAFENGDFRSTMVKVYLARIAAEGSLMLDFFEIYVNDWDGVTNLARHPVSDSDSIDAVKAYAATVLAELEGYDAGDLNEGEAAMRDKALYYMRQAATGSTGAFVLGGDDLKGPVGIGYLAYDLMYEYASVDNDGLGINPDVNDFYEQVNALYLKTQGKGMDKGVAAALTDIFYYSSDPTIVQYYLGNGEPAKVYTQLTGWYIEKLAASADASKACTLYSSEDREQVWNAATADLYFNNDGDMSFEDFDAVFDAFAQNETANYQSMLTAALDDFGTRNAKDVSAAITAVGDETRMGAMLSAAKNALSVGDAMDFQDELDGLTKVGGYADANAEVTNEDNTRIQAMWDRFTAYVHDIYGIDTELLPADVIVVNDEGSDTDVDGSITIGLAEPLNLAQIYAEFIHEGAHAMNYLAGQAVPGATWEGSAEVAQHSMIADVLTAVLPQEGVGESEKYYLYLLTTANDAVYLATTEATIKRYMREDCAVDDTVAFAYGIADKWGVTNENERDSVVIRSHETTTYLGLAGGEVLYSGILDTLNSGWNRTADVYSLIGCTDPVPDVSAANLDATRAALESCL